MTCPFIVLKVDPLDCFSSLAMTFSFIGIFEASQTEPDKFHSHCEDPPNGGDEAISWVINTLYI
jgi:hypothetical protein